MTTFAIFDVHALILTDKLRKQLMRDLPTTDSIAAVMGFSEASIYANPAKRLEGVFVVTGPEVQTHVFTYVGLKRKYRGTLTQGQSMMQLGTDLSRYMVENHQPLYHDFRGLCNNVHQALTSIAKTQLEQKL